MSHREHHDPAALWRARVERDWQESMTLPRWFPLALVAVFIATLAWSYFNPWGILS